MKLDYKKTIFVGMAFFLICTFWQAYDTIIPKILTDKFGMSQANSGIIMAADNVLALFMLPLFGTISDRCRSKLGRRTPFIIVGTLVAALALVGLTFVDNAQLKQIESVSAVDDPAALELIYEKKGDEVLKTTDGEEFVLSDIYTLEEYKSITADIVLDGKTVTNPEYTEYVVTARQAYIHDITQQDYTNLILFIAVLFIMLVSMATFRSPAVALMPDVTVKPLRSKANAVINLMGTAGGIIVLGLGIVFKTGSIKNSMMSYTAYFCIVAGVMLISLMIFLWRVKEPALVERMKDESREYGIDTEEESEVSGEKHKLSGGQKLSLALILASVVFWFMGYNAVTSKYSVYASNVLNIDYSSTLMVANVAAIIAYIPVGMVASKIGRKKTILCGITMLTTAFFVAAFMRSDSSALVMNLMFALAGIGWATINVNSFPMVVELSRGSDVGKYTGFYYTASMAAQTLTPYISGLLMDGFGMTVLFPYAAIFVALAFVTMLFVKHGDSKPIPAKSKLEALDVDD